MPAFKIRIVMRVLIEGSNEVKELAIMGDFDDEFLQAFMKSVEPYYYDWVNFEGKDCCKLSAGEYQWFLQKVNNINNKGE